MRYALSVTSLAGYANEVVSEYLRVYCSGETVPTMNLEMQDMKLPAQVEVKIEVSVTANIVCTDVAAQRKVSKLLLDSVGNLLYGERPSLVAGERLLWRVPIWLGLPSSGPVGQVGALDVDAQSGEILYSQPMLDEIATRAHGLAQRTPSATT